MTDKNEILRNCEFLAGAPADMLATLAAKAETRRVAADEIVITKGDLGSAMYIIIEGRVRVHDNEVDLAGLGAGEVFGEMAVLDSDVRSASVTTDVDSILLSLDRDSLFEALAEHPECFQTILQAVLHRERKIVHDVKTRTEALLAYERELEIGSKHLKLLNPTGEVACVIHTLGFDVFLDIYQDREEALNAF